MNPKIFVGSSSEGRHVAYAIQESLEGYNFQVTVWPQDTFKLSGNALDSLIGALDRFDFGVFVFSPDDIADMRGRQKKVARDNVVFELGLFMGRLGKRRNFVVMPEGIHLPTDLAGFTAVKYDPNRTNVVAAVGAACNKISREINRLSLEDKTWAGIIYEEYIGARSLDKCVVIAHCDDAAKFAGLGLLSPGGTIVQKLVEMPASIGRGAVQVNFKSTVNWQQYTNVSTFFIVDSPHYNPYMRWILKHYNSYLEGGAVEFTEEVVDGTVKQDIRVGSKLFESDKQQGMKTFDEFKDYLLIMRLPGILPSISQSKTDISEVNRSKIIWTIGGVHSKASYVGAKLFSPKNLEKFVSGLPDEYRKGPPEYFEAVYEVPRTPNIVEDFADLKLVHFSLLRLRTEIGVEDGIPPGLARFFVDGDRASLKNIQIYTVHFDPVAACNFKCPHCIESQERGKSLFLSFDTIVKILCDLRELGCGYLNFYGGEPTLHPKFSAILRLASNMGFRMLIVTNGSLLSKDDICKTIVQNKRQLSLRVSLDGNSHKTHSANHGLSPDDDYFTKTRDSVVEIIGKGVSVVVSFLLLDNCISEIEEACKFWKDKGATAFSLRPVTSLNGMDPKLDYNIAKGSKIKRVLDKYRGWVIVPTWFREYITTGRLADDPKPYDKCYSAYYRFAISPHQTGDVGLGKPGLEETGKAWISLCPYRRYDAKYGCEYPEDLREWAREERLTKLEGINPAKDDCEGIICCRDKHNRRVVKEIQNCVKM